MSIIQSVALLGAAGQGPSADLGDPIDQSLRFPNTPSSTENAVLTRSASSVSTWTASFWVKHASIANGYIFSSSNNEGFRGGNSSSDSRPNYFIDSNHRYTAGEHNDLSAWYHYVITYDGSNLKIYVNGALDLTYPTSNGNLTLSRIGGYNGFVAFAGYLAAFMFIDGTAVSDTNGVIDEFGRYNTDGVWVPQDYTGSFGTNGFHLDFADGSDPGNDVSGNNNDWTATGFDTTAISGSNPDNDVDFNDTPTSNYATLNPLGGPNLATPIDANLTGTNTSATWTNSNVFNTVAMTTGRWYWEVTVKDWSGDLMLGIGNYDATVENSASYIGSTANGWAYYSTGNKYNNSGFTAYGDSWNNTSTFPTIGFAFDADTRTIWASKNGVWQGGATLAEIEAGTTTNSMFTGMNGTQWFPAVSVNGTAKGAINFGQMPFIYTQPSGFNAWQTNNLPEPTIKNGKEYFDVVTYTGNGSTQSITGLEFQPDFVWLKSRNVGYHNRLFDVIRGQSSLVSDDTRAEGTSSDSSLTSFDSNGFSITQTTNESYNQSTKTYVAWCWKAGGTAVSNTNGTITSSVSANTDAGFSIVSYTGTGSNGTIGHGLNSAPEFIITKNRDSSTISWGTYHIGSGSNNILFLNATNAQSAAAEYWQNTDPTASVFSVGTSGFTNNATDNYIAYCWHSVEGFSKFGSYTGNGNADGPFIYTGMKVAWVLIKQTSVSGNPWIIIDSTRDINNPCTANLFPNTSGAEFTGGGNEIDLLSNGFKLRNSGNTTNQSGQTYIYATFAENPFGGENAPPATAR